MINPLDLVYFVQIAVLVVCIFMVFRIRKMLNGLARGLILLFVLLIARRVDDIWGVYTNAQTAILSSAVVAVVAYDIWQIYRARKVYALYFRNRQKRITELESLRKDSAGRDKWIGV